jgi:hypothetical protein
MKLFDILKQSGLFANDIKLRIKNNQITINGDVIKDNIDLNIELNEDGTAKIIDADDFLFWTLKGDNVIRCRQHRDFDLFWSLRIDEINKMLDLETQKFKNQIKIFGFENLFGSNIENELTKILNEFIFIRTSKKETFLLKKAR